MLALIHFFFSMASRIAPKLSGRAAFRLFCTTFEPRKKSAQHRKILNDAEALFESATQHTVHYRGGTIAAYEFEPTSLVGATHDNTTAADQPAADRTVWLVHGWQSHSLFMSQFITPLLAQRFRVICIDLPGHGNSSGRQFHLPLAVSALHAVREKLGEFDCLLSHSLGGAVAATTLAGTLSEYPALPVSKLVLISAPDSMIKIFDDFGSMVGLNHKANAALHDMVTRLSGKVTADFSTGLQLQTVDTELLVIHAPDDKEVPFKEAEAILHANPSATLTPMPGLGHRRIIASTDVVSEAVNFIAS